MIRHCGAWFCERLERRVALASLTMETVGEMALAVVSGEEENLGTLEGLDLRLRVELNGGQPQLSILGADGLRCRLSVGNVTANRLADDATDRLLVGGMSGVIELWVEVTPGRPAVQLAVAISAETEPTAMFVSHADAAEMHQGADDRFVIEASSALSAAVHFEHPSSVDLSAPLTGHVLANDPSDPHLAGLATAGSGIIPVRPNSQPDHGFDHRTTPWFRGGTRLSDQHGPAGDRGRDRSHGINPPARPFEWMSGMDDESASWSDSIDWLHGAGDASSLASDELLAEMGEWRFDSVQAPRSLPSPDRVGEAAAHNVLAASPAASPETLEFVSITASPTSPSDLPGDANGPHSDDVDVALGSWRRRRDGWAVACFAAMAAFELDRHAARITASAARGPAAESRGSMTATLHRQHHFSS